MRACVLVVCLTFIGCGSSPTAPSAHWTLSGTVRSASTPLSGARVAILDGPNQGQAVTTNTAGMYSFAALQPGGFTIEVSETNYVTTRRGVTLTDNLVVDIDLAKVPQAILSAGGPLPFDHIGANTWGVHATATNTGDACAASIGGTISINSSSGVRTLSFTLPTSTVVRPNESFTYAACCFTDADLTAIGTVGTYTTQFTFTSIACS